MRENIKLKIRANEDRLIKSTNIIVHLIAYTLSFLCSYLISWDELTVWVSKIELSSRSILFILTIACIGISSITSVLTIVYMRKKYRMQQRRMEAMLKCCKIANSGNYKKELEELYISEEITSKELDRFRHALDTFSTASDFYNDEIIRKNIESIHNVANKLSDKDLYDAG